MVSAIDVFELVNFFESQNASHEVSIKVYKKDGEK